MIAAHPFSPNELGVLIHKHKYTNIQIYKYTNTNIDIEIHIYKRKHHKLYLTDYTAHPFSLTRIVFAWCCICTVVHKMMVFNMNSVDGM